jgi:hypothetical protein
MIDYLLRTWARIKEIRNTQGFISTNVNLIIFQQDANVTEDKARFESLFSVVFTSELNATSETALFRVCLRNAC